MIFTRKISLEKLALTHLPEKHAQRLIRLTKLFEKSYNIKLNSHNFNEDMAVLFSEYITLNKIRARSQGYFKSSTVLYYCKQICALINRAKRDGYKTSGLSISHFNIKHDEPYAVYLSLNELNKLNQLKLTGAQAQVRDLFLIGCYTGLRVSDYLRLNKSNFLNGKIEVLTKKTNTRVVVPIHKVIAEIIERNHGYAFLKTNISVSSFNFVLKDICRKAKFCQKVSVEYNKAGTIVREILPKYQLVSSHTARRSAATNMYLAGIPTAKIMLITGHKTEASFFKYIRINKQENAKDLSQHPFFV